MVINLFRAKIKLGQSLPRASKSKAIEFLHQVIKPEPKIVKPKIVNKKPKIKTQIIEKPKYTDKQMKQFVEEIHKPFKKPRYLRKMKFKSKDHIWNADLIIMPEQDEYKYILTVLDGYTRYGFAQALKHKDAKSVSNAFKEIMKKSKRNPN